MDLKKAVSNVECICFVGVAGGRVEGGKRRCPFQDSLGTPSCDCPHSEREPQGSSRVGQAVGDQVRLS